MKHVKMNYRQLSINKLTDSGMSTQEATSYYNRIYNQALRSANKSARENLNVARELYVNMFVEQSAKSVFQIDYKNNRVVLNELFKDVGDIGVAKTIFRMNRLYELYAKDSPMLKNIFNQYTTGQISRKEFNAKIKDWKKVSIRYMLSGSD